MMESIRRFQAPSRNGELLAVPGFDAIAPLVDANQSRFDEMRLTIDGIPVKSLRAQANREILTLAELYTIGSKPGPQDGPLLITGHQPELSHPGVWVKNFAAHGLAKKIGGTALNLVVDNDTLKTRSLRFPKVDLSIPEAHLESIPFDKLSSELPYEESRVNDANLFRTFVKRAEPTFRDWGFQPLLEDVWAKITELPESQPIGERFSQIRRNQERAWGCHNLELPVSQLSRTDAFTHFARHILNDLELFRDVYNGAIYDYRERNGVRSANHPAPFLEEGEAPFWVARQGQRQRASRTSDPKSLRPRALTLTLFARLCLGDFFIHGIGGGKYDDVTDAIIRGYFEVTPPSFQVLSATLHLPLQGFETTRDDLKQSERLFRDLRWNPERYFSPTERQSHEVQLLLQEKANLISRQLEYHDHVARKARFRRLQEITATLYALVGAQVPNEQASLDRVKKHFAINQVLRRRDYSWVLFPEELLRKFLTKYLDV